MKFKGPLLRPPLPYLQSLQLFLLSDFKYYPPMYAKYLTVVSLLCGFLKTFRVRSAMGAVCPTNLFLLHLMALHFIKSMPFLFSYHKNLFLNAEFHQGIQ
jgi:hypothetical protein